MERGLRQPAGGAEGGRAGGRVDTLQSLCIGVAAPTGRPSVPLPFSGLCHRQPLWSRPHADPGELHGCMIAYSPPLTLSPYAPAPTVHHQRPGSRAEHLGTVLCPPTRAPLQGIISGLGRELNTGWLTVKNVIQVGGGGLGRGTGVHNPGPGEDQRPPCPLAPHSPRWMLPSTRATAAVCCWTAGGGSSASTGLLRILQGREPAPGWALQFRYQWPR